MTEECTAMLKLSEPQRGHVAQQLNERYTELKHDKRAPANFWADIKRDADIAEFLLVVTTYKPKSNDQ